MEPGTLIEIKTSNNEYEGIVMPSSDKKQLTIKLKNGYNMGINKKDIKSTKILKERKQTKRKKEKIKEKKHLKKIAILHTGGTIASNVDYETGAVSAKFSPEDLIRMFPEIKEIANISSKLLSNMFSEDLRFYHYNVLAKAVEKEVKNKVDGIIITHGTDTMHYTSAALSLALENLPVPILLVGAQRSSDRGSSDAAMNLICALRFMNESDFAGVATCMHSSESDDKCYIIKGTKARKMHSSQRDAFKPINKGLIAEIDYKTNNIHYFEKFEKWNGEKLKLKLFKENLKIGMLYIHPQMFAEDIKHYENYDGLVLIGTGLGHLPINVIDDKTKEHKKIFNALKTLAKKIPVVMTTQTIYGRVNMNVYSTGRILQEMGILGNLSDNTPETSFIKLAWKISNKK